jgi:hypothetical protein
MKSLTRVVIGSVVAASFGSAAAATASWTDWTSAPAGAALVNGTLDVSGTAVGITFSGAYSFAQVSGGTNYWNPPGPYQSGTVENAPPAADIIALAAGGVVTLTFSQAVKDPLIALVSWNSNTVDFGTPIEVLSFGQGFWGNGTPVVNAAGTGFFGSGEVHGVIRLPGNHTSVTISHTSENWHGLTVGVLGLGEPPPIPEPSTYGLFALGLLGLALRRRRG